MKIFEPQNYPSLTDLNYDEYHAYRGMEINKKLKAREEIMLYCIKRTPRDYPKDFDPHNVPPKRVLDVGCGNSRLPLALREQGCDVTVADISPTVLLAYANLGFKTILIDLNQQDIQDEYDFIIMSEVLEHLPNPESVIAKLKQHTTYFLLTVPNTGYYTYRLQLLFGRFPKQWLYHPGEHLRFWTRIDFIDWLRAQGLSTFQAIPSNGFDRIPLFRDFWPNLFGFQIVYLCRVPEGGM